MTRPLLAEWAVAREGVAAALAKSKKHGDKAWQQAQAGFVGFLERLKHYRVLDPACGSGNFLYLALKALKDVEHQVNLEAEALGLERQIDGTGPHNVLGIELNEYAAELARVTVWIGELQWRVQRGYAFKMDPVLEPLDHIECRDAVLAGDGQPAHWPSADAVVGNPPFVGDKKMRAELGDAYTEALRAAYKGRVPGGADLVCYWFEQARRVMAEGRLKRAGLVSTNSIRGGKNREVLDAIVKQTRIFEAWSDEAWVNDGAAVRVSLVAFGDAPGARLDGVVVDAIQTDLTGDASVEMALATRLEQSRGASFIGPQQNGPFNVEGPLARQWLREPNVAGANPSLVVKPWTNGRDLTTRPSDTWIIDFGNDMSESDASLMGAPFEHVRAHVKPMRWAGNRESRKKYWWRLGEPAPALRDALSKLPRSAVTVRVAKHRLWAWLPTTCLPDVALVVVARADDTTFGLLHSRLHELWTLRMCTWLGKGNDPRYTPTTCFETFPFPAGLTPADTAHQRTEPLASGALIPADLPPAVRAHAEAIAQAAHRLVALRDAWLNPPEWTERLPEVVPLGLATSPYPERIVARPGFEAELAKRTLTNLYNQRPTWLAQAHATLDAAVAAAFGWADWTAQMPDDEILRRLLALNHERAAEHLAPRRT